jgi:hypothetical protein
MILHIKKNFTFEMRKPNLSSTVDVEAEAANAMQTFFWYANVE